MPRGRPNASPAEIRARSLAALRASSISVKRRDRDTYIVEGRWLFWPSSELFSAIGSFTPGAFISRPRGVRRLIATIREERSRMRAVWPF